MSSSFQCLRFPGNISNEEGIRSVTWTQQGVYIVPVCWIYKVNSTTNHQNHPYEYKRTLVCTNIENAMFIITFHALSDPKQMLPNFLSDCLCVYFHVSCYYQGRVIFLSVHKDMNNPIMIHDFLSWQLFLIGVFINILLSSAIPVENGGGSNS